MAVTDAQVGHLLSGEITDGGEDGQRSRPQEGTSWVRRRGLIALGLSVCILVLLAVAGLPGAPRETFAKAGSAVRGYDFACYNAANDEYRRRRGVCKAVKNEGVDKCSRDRDCKRGVYKAYNKCLFAGYDCKKAMQQDCRSGNGKPMTELEDCKQEEETTGKPITTLTTTTPFSMSDCAYVAIREHWQRERVCKDMKVTFLAKCAGAKKESECKTQGFNAFNECNKRISECKDAMIEECSAEKMPKAESIEACQVAEKKEIESDQSFKLRVGQSYEFYTLSSCPGGTFCNHGLHSSGIGMPRIITRDDERPTLLRLDAAEKPDEYYLMQHDTCRFHGSVCNMTLAATEDDCPLAFSQKDYQCKVAQFAHVESPDPYKAVPVEGKPDQFFFVNQAGCPDGPRCGWHLSMDTEDCENQAPKVAIEHLPKVEKDTYGRWKLIAKSDIPDEPVITDEITDKTYNLYTMDSRQGCLTTVCNRPVLAPAPFQQLAAHPSEYGAFPTPIRFEAAGKSPGDYYLRQTADCWKQNPSVCGQGLGVSKTKCGPGTMECFIAEFVAEDPVIFRVDVIEHKMDLVTIVSADKESPYYGWRLALTPDGRVSVQNRDFHDFPSLWRIEAAE